MIRTVENISSCELEISGVSVVEDGGSLICFNLLFFCLEGCFVYRLKFLFFVVVICCGVWIWNE